MEQIAKALVAFRAGCPQVGFDSRNPHFDSKFASLKAIHAAVDPVLAKHGLAVVQFPVGDETTAGCITTIIHESGETMAQEFRVPIGKSDAQKACAAVSYARRFGLSGALGIVTTDDVDGNDAVGVPPGMTLSDGNKEKLRVVAEMKASEYADDETITAKVVTQEALKAVGLAWGDIHDKNYGHLFSAIQEWEPGA